MKISLQSVKKHLNIEQEYKFEDDILMDMIKDASNIVLGDSNRTMDEIDKLSDVVRSYFRRAVLLKIGDLYRYRESTDTSTPHPLPMGYEFYVNQIRDYGSSKY